MFKKKKILIFRFGKFKKFQVRNFYLDINDSESGKY